MQDAFERLHRGWHWLRQPSSGLAYVRSSVLNGCRSVHRRAAVARKHLPELAEPDAAADTAAAADDRGEMAAALRSLPGRGGNLLSARTLRLPPLPVLTRYSLPESAFITPDGRAVIASTLAGVGSGQAPAVDMKVVEWSLRSGRLLRVLLEGRERPTLAPPSELSWVFSLGPTGLHALIQCPYSKFVFGRWDNDRFTPLPGMSDVGGPDFAAW